MDHADDRVISFRILVAILYCDLSVTKRFLYIIAAVHKTSNDLNHLQPPGCMSMEMPILGVDTSEPLAMDSDDLVSSFTVKFTVHIFRNTADAF